MKLTPMMQQYFESKDKHPDAVMLFRMGDFYEMFFEDAKLVSRELGLTLTARHKGEPNEVPMAGIPHHAAQGYVAKLVGKGYTVAICDQLTAPQKGKGIVRRGVTRVITPGVVSDPEILDEKDFNYLVAVCQSDRRKNEGFGVASIDASTGDFRVTEVSTMEKLATELTRIQPREIIVPEDEAALYEGLRSVKTTWRRMPKRTFDQTQVLRQIKEGDALDSDLHAKSLFVEHRVARNLVAAAGNGRFRDKAAVERAIVGVLGYLIYAQRGVGIHIRDIDVYHAEEFVTIDESTAANLEVTQTLMGGRKQGSLLSVIDETVTAMGGRRLRTWLSYPLVNPAAIEERLDAVQVFVDGVSYRERVRELLTQTYDVERLTSKLAGGVANARDLVALRSTLGVIPELKQVLASAPAHMITKLADELDPCSPLMDLIEEAIVDEPPAGVREGGLIRKGYNDELDELLDIVGDGKDWLIRYEAEQRQATQITSLKVKYNKVFGYFIDITKANLHLVPDHYVRKQTLTNSERYITDELKEYEDKVLNAEDRKIELEYRLFEEVRNTTAEYVGQIRHSAQLLATLDVLAGLGEVANKQAYTRPEVNDSNELQIQGGRHPVVEKTMTSERFVPNDTRLDTDDQQLMIITGPNMAGKSTYIRQVALITLLAQIGSFVPAKKAVIGVVDKIFSRVGASDNLAKGQSTFMVEMTETAHILSNATPKSLIILDEIGRGTSTYDGLSIAWAVTEYLHDEIGARSLFATHYHELTSLEDTMSGVRNLSIAVKEMNDDVVFLRRIVAGPANRSYGVQVGKLAGLPEPVVERAKEILANLERVQKTEDGTSTLGAQADGTIRKAVHKQQMSLLGPAKRVVDSGHAKTSQGNALSLDSARLLREIAELDINSTTPLEALNLVYKWKQNLRGSS